MTKEQVTEMEQKISQEDPEAIEWLEQAKKEKIEPLEITLFVSIWIVFILLAFLPTYFEAGVIGNILKVIPNVIKNIEIASDERNTLEKENIRMGMELDVAKKIQTMVLPDKKEIATCQGLEVGARMDTAVEVGGDFYDVLPQKDGSTIFGIGDVTDHGLQSGVVMLMTQSAFRATTDEAEMSLTKALIKINTVIFNNVQTRLKDFRNLTLSLLKYKEGKVTLAGQHETILIYRKETDSLEEIKTMDLGLYIGMIENIEKHINETTFTLNHGDIMLLYTDGVTEAENKNKEFFGSKRLKQTFKNYSNKNSQEIVDKITDEIYEFIEDSELYDDITLVAVKRV